jgi:phage terminase large subunit-like protein
MATLDLEKLTGRECFGGLDLFGEALAGEIRHGAHPVLTAAVSTAVLVSDPAGNMKFAKEQSSNAASIRIDPIVALTMAIAAASKVHPDPGAALSAAILARGGFA